MKKDFSIPTDPAAIREALERRIRAGRTEARIRAALLEDVREHISQALDGAAPFTDVARVARDLEAANESLRVLVDLDEQMYALEQALRAADPAALEALEAEFGAEPTEVAQ